MQASPHQPHSDKCLFKHLKDEHTDSAVQQKRPGKMKDAPKHNVVSFGMTLALVFHLPE